MTLLIILLSDCKVRFHRICLETKVTAICGWRTYCFVDSLKPEACYCGWIHVYSPVKSKCSLPSKTTALTMLLVGELRALNPVAHCFISLSCVSD